MSRRRTQSRSANWKSCSSVSTAWRAVNPGGKDWEGIPCILPDWIYTADLTIFEARQAIKRQNANHFADVVGIDASESEEAEILRMIRAARDAANAARTAEHELVIEARARGISHKKIGDVLGLKEAGVGMYLSRASLTAERQEEINRELQAWVLLTKLWARDVESDEPGESFFLHGVNQLLLAQQQFEQCVQLQIVPHSRRDGGQGRARRQRGGGLGWARSVQGIVPTTLAAISVRSAGSQARTVPA